VVVATKHPIRQALSAQQAPASHLERMTSLLNLVTQSPACLALGLVGSYAKGCGDRISDLDLVALTVEGTAQDFIGKAHEALDNGEILNWYAGTHGSRGRFRKYIYLDFASCELHAFDLPTDFKLRRPYIPVWDPQNLLETCVVEGEPPGQEEFDAYQHGDEGLVWELVDCIKWLQRGRVTLTKDYLRKLVAKL
jgi:hypothetical protein